MEPAEEVDPEPRPTKSNKRKTTKRKKKPVEIDEEIKEEVFEEPVVVSYEKPESEIVEEVIATKAKGKRAKGTTRRNKVETRDSATNVREVRTRTSLHVDVQGRVSLGNSKLVLTETEIDEVVSATKLSKPTEPVNEEADNVGSIKK
jgi:hypothetical protein